MPQPETLFCLGYGYTAEALARRLRAQGFAVRGTTRSEEKAGAMRAEGLGARVWRDAFDPAWLDGATHILVSTPPDDGGCPAFRAASEAIARRRRDIAWIGYLSTNGVYGDHGGAWVDETSPLKPSSERARRRVRAEADWAGSGAAFDLPLIIFRLPGIYGPGRSALDTVREGNAKRVFKEGQVFSRMHADDIAAALSASMANPRLFDLYNLADDEPAPPQDVVEYACGLLGADPPPLVPLEEADLSDMAKGFYADNKRVSNRRMKEALGVTLKYPTYREGLKAIFEAEANCAVGRGSPRQFRPRHSEREGS